jgi:hypothetical protein
MNESHIQDVLPAQTSTDLAVRYAAKTAVVCALVSLWAFQYMVWVPVVWACRMAKAIVVFALGSTGHIMLLCLPIFGWFWLAYLLIRQHPERVYADDGYLRPWFASVLASGARKSPPPTQLDRCCHATESTNHHHSVLSR